MSEVLIRPMLEADLEVCEEISDDAFFEVDQRTTSRGGAPPERRTAEHRARWISRSRQIVQLDPGGCWVAEDESGVVGLATSLVREQVWILATYAVRPGRQGAGIGRRLLAATEEYAARAPRGLLSGSRDARAARRYWRSGFVLHPQMYLLGEVDRAQLPAVSGVRDGRPDDVAMMDALARDLRGGGHGPDHASLAATARALVAETATGRGFAYATSGRVDLLAATDEATARSLLWACLADAEETFVVPHVTGANPWAVDVGLTAGLSLGQGGYLATRGMAPPAPYIHNGALL